MSPSMRARVQSKCAYQFSLRLESFEFVRCRPRSLQLAGAVLQRRCLLRDQSFCSLVTMTMMMLLLEPFGTGCCGPSMFDSVSSSTMLHYPFAKVEDHVLHCELRLACCLILLHQRSKKETLSC
jgi:hypothetical protein